MMRRRLERAQRILDHIRANPKSYPQIERKKNGRAMQLNEEDAQRLYEEGLKVVVVPDPENPRPRYAYLVFLELDLVVKSELGPLPHQAITAGRLFMLPDFVETFGPKKGEPMEALIIEEVQNMALTEEVKEFRRQRNRAMLASWGELKIQAEKDALRTMTWADSISGCGTTSSPSGGIRWSARSPFLVRPQTPTWTRKR